MVFQQPLLFPHMTVEENVAFGLKMQGVPKATRLQKAREMLESVGLSGLGQYVPSQLSGGQQQRVSLLRALVAQPRVLLMDEPFSALDQELRGEMRELVRQLHREHGLTILFVTHDVDEAFALADRIGVMKEGRILQVGEPLELYEHPINPAVAQCLGAKNVIYGELCGSVFRSGDFEVKVTRAKNDDVKSGWLVIRPETLQVVEAPTEDANLLQGMVKEVSFRAGIYYFKVIVNSQCLHVLHGGRSTFKPRLGQVVALTYDSKLVQFIPEHS